MEIGLPTTPKPFYTFQLHVKNADMDTGADMRAHRAPVLAQLALKNLSRLKNYNESIVSVKRCFFIISDEKKFFQNFLKIKKSLGNQVKSIIRNYFLYARDSPDHKLYFETVYAR